MYLTDEEVDDLRRTAEITGRSQSELIREGIRLMVAGAGLHERRFHSLGKGHGRGAHYVGWDSADVYAEVMGTE